MQVIKIYNIVLIGEHDVLLQGTGKCELLRHKKNSKEEVNKCNQDYS